MPNYASLKKSDEYTLKNFWLLALFAIFFVLAFARTHVRNQSTLLGYEIGRLKKQEVVLLEHRSHLKVQLARITAREQLLTLAQP